MSTGPAGRRRRPSPLFVSSLLLISHDESLLSPVASALERAEWMASQRTVGKYKSRQIIGWFRPFRLGFSCCRPDLQISILEAALGLRCGGGSAPSTTSRYNVPASTIQQTGHYQIQAERNIPPPPPPLPPPPPPLPSLNNHSPRHTADADTRGVDRRHDMGQSALHRVHSIAPTIDDPIKLPPLPPPPPLIHRNTHTRSSYDMKSTQLAVNRRRLLPPPPPPPIPREKFQHKRPHPQPPPVHVQRNRLDHERDANDRMASNSNDRMPFLAQSQPSTNTDRGDARPTPFLQSFPPPPPPPPPLTPPDMNWDDIEQSRAYERGTSPLVDYTREIVSAALAEADNFGDSSSSDSYDACREGMILDTTRSTNKVQGPNTAKGSDFDEEILIESNGIDVNLLRKLVREEVERVVVNNDTPVDPQSSSLPAASVDTDSINDTHLAHPSIYDGFDMAVDEFDSDHIDESVLHRLDTMDSFTDHYYDPYDDSCLGDDTSVYEDLETGYHHRMESELTDSVEAHLDKAHGMACDELGASQYEDFDSDYIDKSILESLEFVDSYIDDGESSDDDAYHGLEADCDSETIFGELPVLAVFEESSKLDQGQQHRDNNVGMKESECFLDRLIIQSESPLPTNSAFAGYGVPILSSPSPPLSAQYRREDRRVEIPANGVDLFTACKAAAKCIKQETLSNSSATYGMPTIKFQPPRKRRAVRKVQRTILSRLDVDGICSINEDELDQIIANLKRNDDESFESIEEQSSDETEYIASLVQYDFAHQMRKELASVYFATDGREESMSSAMNGVGDTEGMHQDERASELLAPYDDEEYSYDYEYEFITEEY